MKLMASTWLAVTLCVSAQAQTVDQPSVQVGDTWTYRQTNENRTGFKESQQVYEVTRKTGSTIYFDVRQAGSQQPPKSLYEGADWRRMRAVNGTETVVNQPLNFPLATGKHWDVHFREEHPNKAHAWEEFDDTYTVVGTEHVEVPAGKFDAIKIEIEGKWQAETIPSSTVLAEARGASGTANVGTQIDTVAAHRIEGRTYKAYWYVPTVRRWVKSVEEIYSAGGDRSERYTAELTSYQVK